MLTAVALALSYIEAITPLNLIIPLPGFKLGLANIAVMAAFLILNPVYGVFAALAKIALISVMFGSPVSFWFSLSGGIFSLVALFLVRFLIKDRLGCAGIGVLCASAHNTGQALAACALFGYSVLITYLPLMLIFSIPTGLITGTVYHSIQKPFYYSVKL